jgi:hypothetical protein
MTMEGSTKRVPAATPPRPLKLVGTFRSSLDIYTADVIVCDDEDRVVGS